MSEEATDAIIPKLEDYPEYIRWKEVILLFEIWGIGNASYLQHLVETGLLKKYTRPFSKKSTRYKTADVFAIYGNLT